jgi:hypothetical protein
MDESKKREAEHEEAKAKYERTDARISAVVMAGLVILATVVLFSAGVWWLLIYYERRAYRDEVPISPLLRPDEKRLPPEPRLQVSPQVDMYELQRIERELLTTYGWTDVTSGIARIPIERAITITAERGLPATETTGTQPEVIALDTASGRAPTGGLK